MANKIKLPKMYKLEEFQNSRLKSDKGLLLMADYVIGNGLWKNKRFLKNLIIEKGN